MKRKMPFNRQKKVPLVVLFTTVLSLTIIGGIVFAVYSIKLYKASTPSIASLYEQWNAQSYESVYKDAQKRLEQYPLEGESLALYGFAAYYLFTQQTDASIGQTYLKDAIASLRQALYTIHESAQPKVAYMLGKAYYQQGYYYADLAAKYLDMAEMAHFIAPDLAEFRGMVAVQLNDGEKALESFTHALADNPSDLLLYALAENYEKMNNSEKAKLYLSDTIDKTQDRVLELQCRNKLISFYLAEGNLIAAEQEINTVLQKDTNSAEAHYSKGLLYEAQGETVKARAQWRKALQLNPLYEPVRKKLNL